MKEQESWIKVRRESFATDEDWETVCEEVGADPEEADYVIIYIAGATVVDKEN